MSTGETTAWRTALFATSAPVVLDDKADGDIVDGECLGCGRRRDAGHGRASPRTARTQLGTALRKANQSKGGVPEDIRLVLGLDRMIHHLAAYGKAQRKPKPDAIRKRLAADYAVSHYDVTFAVADPNPESASARGPDPILDGSSAPTAAPSSATRALLDRPSSQGAA
jgi:hypothetical protein